jgi:hypothetical protein
MTHILEGTFSYSALPVFGNSAVAAGVAQNDPSKIM